MRRSTKRRATRQAFTLIELMIAVAIIGVLASIAIPSFLRFQLRSKTSEAKANLAAIWTSEVAYHAEEGRYLAAPASPAAYGGTMSQAFVATGPTDAGFEALGWSPEGNVFFNYAVVTSSGGSGAYAIDAAADIDGNGTPQIWGYISPNRNGGVVASARGCTATWTGTAVDGLSTVGACAANFGSTEF